jgi:hypothetical protein
MDRWCEYQGIFFQFCDIEKIIDFFPKKSENLVEFTLAKIQKNPHFFEKLTYFFSKNHW